MPAWDGAFHIVEYHFSMWHAATINVELSDARVKCPGSLVSLRGAYLKLGSPRSLSLPEGSSGRSDDGLLVRFRLPVWLGRGE